MSVWIDKSSVLEHKGKTIEFGDTVPSDVPKESLAKFIKSGRVADSVPTVPMQADLVAELKDQIIAILAENKALTEQLEESKGLAGQLEESKGQVAALTEQLLTKQQVPEGAGPKGKGK